MLAGCGKSLRSLLPLSYLPLVRGRGLRKAAGSFAAGSRQGFHAEGSSRKRNNYCRKLFFGTLLSTIADVPNRMNSTRDKVRMSALTVGLAVIVGVWMFVAAFAPEIIEDLGGYSPWVLGPASTAAWALFSGVAYAVLRRSYSQNAATDPLGNYRCPKLAATANAPDVSLCAGREEKRRLGAATAGFALTIASWVTLLSFMPEAWSDSLNEAPAWFYSLVSIGLWAALSTVMYLAFRASEERPTPLRNKESGIK